MLKKVVLPAPFGPIRLTIDPVGIVNSMSLTAMRPPNSLRSLSACSRSVIRRIPVGEAALVRDVVERRIRGPLLDLLLVPALGDQPGRPEEHHQHDDQPVDPELVLRRVEVDAGLVE